MLSFSSPEVGFEPTTNGLTVHCSTAELFRIRDGTRIVRSGIFFNREMKKMWRGAEGIL